MCRHEPSQLLVEWVEGVAIPVPIFAIVLVGSVKHWEKLWQFRKLNKTQLGRLHGHLCQAHLGEVAP